ncbi:MAG: methylamine utilization protein [Deltaproteobacteria bacterium]|nr:methylamine utilization protein [Deltaproteobacteria bacterium]
MSRIAAALLGVLALACSREPPDDPVIHIPANLGATLPQPDRNPITTEGVALGRRLFFDPRLSGPNTIACATCHQPEHCYSDGQPRSIGASGKPLPRHTPALINLAWAKGLFWDGGAKNLESQVFGPLTSPDEMAADTRTLVAELAEDPELRAAFERAFPSEGLTLGNIARAIAQFERTLIFADSPYDHRTRGESTDPASELEQRGHALFLRHCASCHIPDQFTDFEYHDIGLDAAFSDADERLAWGRARITGNLHERGAFKTPTLRNVALTAPYMHDGRFTTLAQVLEHYRHGIIRLPPTSTRRCAAPTDAPASPSPRTRARRSSHSCTR